MSHTTGTTTPTGLHVISHKNPLQTARRGDHLSVVDANGAKIAYSSSVTQHSSMPATSSSVAANSAKTVNGVVDWDLHSDFHAQNSTHGEAPIKRPLPTPGSFFSNAMIDFLADNPRAKNLVAMTKEFERAFIEASKISELGH